MLTRKICPELVQVLNYVISDRDLMAKVVEKAIITSTQAFVFATDWQLLPGNSQSSFPQAGWHSRHREGCWREPSHKLREPHSSDQPHATASSARIPEVPPPRSLQREKQQWTGVLCFSPASVTCTHIKSRPSLAPAFHYLKTFNNKPRL